VQSLFSFILEEDLPDVLDRRAKRRPGTTEQFERRFRRKDGTTLWVHASVTPMKEEEGRFFGSFAMYTDITDRKQAEVEKHISNPSFSSHRRWKLSAPLPEVWP